MPRTVPSRAVRCFPPPEETTIDEKALRLLLIGFQAGIKRAEKSGPSVEQRSGVSRQRLSDILLGIRPTSRPVTDNLLAAMGVSQDEVLIPRMDVPVSDASADMPDEPAA